MKNSRVTNLTNKKTLTALGLMSGTSMDGVDVALIKTDGLDFLEILGGFFWPYASKTREFLQRIVQGDFSQQAIVEDQVTKEHISAIKAFLREQKIDVNIDVIGFHGHTVLHQPSEKQSIQIGNTKLLIDAFGIDVVDHFRQADIQAGGQGAPLAPLYHKLITQGRDHPVAIVNIGGISNVTWVGQDAEQITAFDTGPGNVLLDEWVKKHNKGHYDKDGEAGFKGKVDLDQLQKLLDHPYYKISPPKSLDRYDFSDIDLSSLSFEDGAATLAALTAHSIEKSRHFFPQEIKSWVITGGGRHNLFLIEQLKKCSNIPVQLIDELGYNGDMIEAQAFAYLAVRSLKGMALTLPQTTGVSEPMTGGQYHMASTLGMTKLSM